MLPCAFDLSWYGLNYGSFSSSFSQKELVLTETCAYARETFPAQVFPVSFWTIWAAAAAAKKARFPHCVQNSCVFSLNFQSKGTCFD